MDRRTSVRGLRGALVGIAVGVTFLYASPAAACWVCPSDGYRIAPVVDEAIPKDGVITFSLGTYGCGDDVWKGLTLTVWTLDDEVPVAGSVEYDGDLRAVYFRPTQPFTPGRTIGARVVVSDTVPGSYDWMCGDSVREAEVTLEILDATTSLPIPATPTLEVTDEPIAWSFADVACCPGSAPSSDTCSSVGFGGAACAAMNQQTLQTFVVAPSGGPKGQIAARLILDGEVVAGSVHDHIADAVRIGPACALLELEHLGTGEVVRSPEVCTPPEVVPTLGIHPVDLASALPCDAPENCDAGPGNYGWEWDPMNCVAIDPLVPPPPSRGHGDWPHASTCGHDSRAIDGSGGPVGPVDPVDPDEPDTSGSAARGCAVATGSPEALLLLVLLGGRRRRRGRRPDGRPCVAAPLPRR